MCIIHLAEMGLKIINCQNSIKKIQQQTTAPETLAAQDGKPQKIQI